MKPAHGCGAPVGFSSAVDDDRGGNMGCAGGSEEGLESEVFGMGDDPLIDR